MFPPQNESRLVNPSRLVAALALLVAGIGLTTGCDSNGNQSSRPFFSVDDRGNSSFNLEGLRDRLNDLPKESLSGEEEASLKFLREEEKLARDVYRTLYDEWEVRALDNIASSEDTHTNAVRLLLDRYDLSDPVGNQPDGSFSNEALQALHDSLVTEGKASEKDALRIGAEIEEIDLVDLNEALNTVVNNEDITLVYENLSKGSRNHLRAFVRTLERRHDVVYEPRHLSRSTYQDIIDSGIERGPN